MVFRHQMTVRFFHIDRAGVVFFPRFFEFCHAAWEELLMTMFGPLEQSFARGEWMAPLVHVHADFVRPARMGDSLHIALAVRSLGEKSATVDYTITRGEPAGGQGRQTGEIVARITLVHAFVQPDIDGVPRAAVVPGHFVRRLDELGLRPAQTGAEPGEQ